MDNVQTPGKRHAVGDLHRTGVDVGIGRDKQAIILVIDGDGAHNIRVATVQNADELANRLAVLQGHAVFTGDGQRFNNAGSRIL
ncbi:hypothetical protein D3C78_1652370 [compost metagenome]